VIVDLFAGPGGWDLAAREFGLEPLGVEFDDAACATRRAAGLSTLQADVSALDPAEFAPCEGLIASPPCQAFSMAGKGAGRRALDVYVEAIERTMEGKPPAAAELDAECDDERAHLVLEPLRWALALRPRWIAFEQVKPVLPLWEAMAVALRSTGYSAWTGVLSSERFGVPQTRQRAFLIASLDRVVGEPVATHQRYVFPRRKAKVESESLFEEAPERVVHPEDQGLLPWVSMADALGWGMTERPYMTIACSRSTGGPDKEKVGSSAARARLYDEQAAGRWIVDTGNTRSGSRKEGRWRAPDEPALRSVDDPAPTIAGESRNDSWVHGRPATTIAGDPRVFQPGGHHQPGQQSQNAIRVSIEEAAVLQSFPADYPWQGNKSKTFQQVGNAVPPGMARAVLEAVVPVRAEVAA
jgi:DNA (cytosine-5)-methyltransferase 1